ncbi:BatA domain-containing protein [uncultured Paraglaciecola sp.]|uniref:BatA domain-containing protein n=1 Tax=uncultured Paraglaciecola sp. TaxID=1765024 RepID=UPI002598741D|nr:BatA domain-containing protein [uncultured Paraglaciecola sp.]
MDKLALTFELSDYLWGLLTLTIPIVIHLLSKHRGKLVPFAHIALIKVKNSPQLNQARLTQWLLLILRLLMLLVACAILAQLVWSENADTSANLVLVSNDWLAQSSDAEKQQLFEELYSSQNSRLFLIDGLNQSLSQRKLESKALLAFQGDTSSTTTPPLNIWANLAEITKTLPKSQKIQLYTTNRLNQFTGKKVAITNPIEWHIKSLPNTLPETKLTASLTIVSDANYQQQLLYVRGALDALATTLPLDLNIEYIDSSLVQEDLDLSQQQSHIIYLADAPLPTELVNSETSIINSEQLQGYTQADFPLTLATKLFAAQTKQWFADNARLSNQQITELPNLDLVNQQQTNTGNAQPLHLWLILILVILFMTERLMSEWPNKHSRQVEGN